MRAALGKVKDPETGLTFGQMKMITSLEELELGVFNLDLVPTSFFCPVVFKLAADVEAAALSVKGVRKALVHCRGHTMEEAINEIVNQWAPASSGKVYFLFHE